MGHPTARKDRVQETENTLTPDLVNHLVNLTSPPEQQDQKTEGLKVTDRTAFIDRPLGAPTVTLTCNQHTWCVAQWNATGTTDRVHTFTPEAKPATPLTLGDRLKHSTHHTNHPRAHWLALKTAMHVHTHSQPSRLHTKARNSKSGTLDVLAHGHGTNPQTSHHRPTRTRKPTSGYAPSTRGAGTGIQHISTPEGTEAGPQTGTRTTAAQAEAPSRESGHLGSPGRTAQTRNKSGPSAAAA